MFASIRSRLLVIAAFAIASIYFLFPRTVTIRERGADGVMHDVEHTRVPLKRGLDLQGGMHLALELDQSQHVSADPKRDLDLALTVLRKRIDEFGVEEPVIQKAGDDRIVVELAGVTQPERAKSIVQRSAFLEFKITDKTGALDKALPAMDRVLRGMGVKAAPGAKASALDQLLNRDSGKVKPARSDTGKAKAVLPGTAPESAKSKTPAADTVRPAADTGALVGGVLSGLIQSAGAAGGG